MVRDIYVILGGIIGTFIVIAGAFFKGRSAGKNEIELELSQDDINSAAEAKSRLESMRSADDDELLERVRKSEQ